MREFEEDSGLSTVDFIAIVMNISRDTYTNIRMLRSQVRGAMEVLANE